MTDSTSYYNFRKCVCVCVFMNACMYCTCMQARRKIGRYDGICIMQHNTPIFQHLTDMSSVGSGTVEYLLSTKVLRHVTYVYSLYSAGPTDPC